MRQLYSLFLLCGKIILPCSAQGDQTAQPPGLENVDDIDKTKRIIHYWADYACYKYSDGSEPNMKEQCKEACFPDGITSVVPAGSYVESSQTCVFSGPEQWASGSGILTEEDKKKPRLRKTITTGYCKCNDPIVNLAGDIFIRSVIRTGEILKNALCSLLKAVDLIVEIGSAAIPGVGKAITTGMKIGIKTAKTIQYAYKAEDAAEEWASLLVDQGFDLAGEAGCDTPSLFSKADAANRFLDLADAPEELVPDINYDDVPCPSGNKASKACKEKNGGKNDEKDDEKHDEKDDKEGGDDSTPRSAVPSQPHSTSNHSPESTSKNSTVEASVQSSTMTTYTRSLEASEQSSGASSSATATQSVDCAGIDPNDTQVLLSERGRLPETEG